MDGIVKHVSSVCKLSHKQFRALLKKFRRNKKRQHLAKLREEKERLEQEARENSPTYKEKKAEQERNLKLLEEFEEKERIRKHKLWLFQEEQAQIEFQKKKHQLELEKQQQEAERKRILAEFEEKQFQKHKLDEEEEKVKSSKEANLQKTLLELSEDEPWHNPYNCSLDNAISETNKDEKQCQFFAKTGCCRFGDRCSRGHIKPDVSNTLLIRGMFSHFSIGQAERDDYDTDIALEFEDKETYKDFRDFYEDVLPEFKKFGKIIQFKVCSNHESHLRGNVYVQYARLEDAIEAYRNFNGRYYAGKQITCEFTHVINWKAAICGLYGRNLCPKGINCNFLHVFKNPRNEFWEADQDFSFRENYNSHSRRSYNERNSHSNHSHRDSLKDDFESQHSVKHKNSYLDYKVHDNKYDLISLKKHSFHDKYKDNQKKKHRHKHSQESIFSSSPSSSDSSYKKNSHKNRKHKKKKAKKEKKRKHSHRSDKDSYKH